MDVVARVVARQASAISGAAVTRAALASAAEPATDVEVLASVAARLGKPVPAQLAARPAAAASAPDPTDAAGPVPTTAAPCVAWAPRVRQRRRTIPITMATAMAVPGGASKLARSQRDTSQIPRTAATPQARQAIIPIRGPITVRVTPIAAEDTTTIATGRKRSATPL
jgi:hypothetical protein